MGILSRMFKNAGYNEKNPDMYYDENGRPCDIVRRNIHQNYNNFSGWDRLWNAFEEQQITAGERAIGRQIGFAEFAVTAAALFAAYKLAEKQSLRAQEQTRQLEQQREQQRQQFEQKMHKSLYKNAGQSNQQYDGYTQQAGQQPIPDVKMTDDIEEAIRKEVKNPTSPLAPKGSYGYGDISKVLIDGYPYSGTQAYQNMSSNDRMAFDAYRKANVDHHANYISAIASESCGFEDCRFFTKDGKEIKPFDLDECQQDFLSQVHGFEGVSDIKRFVAEQSLMNMYTNKAMDAVMYGMDKGEIICELPNGETFDPKNYPQIANDYYTQHLDECEAAAQGFTGVKLQMDNEICRKLEQDIRQYGSSYLEAFTTTQIKPEDKFMFAQESISAQYCVRGLSEYMDMYAKEGVNPKEAILASMGVDAYVGKTDADLEAYMSSFDKEDFETMHEGCYTTNAFYGTSSDGYTANYDASMDDMNGMYTETSTGTVAPDGSIVIDTTYKVVEDTKVVENEAGTKSGANNAAVKDIMNKWGSEEESGLKVEDTMNFSIPV